MSDCFVLYLLLTCMKKKTSGADKFTNNSLSKDLERIIFMVFDAVKMMRSFVEKILKGGIPDTKIGIKSGNLFKDFP